MTEMLTPTSDASDTRNFRGRPFMRPRAVVKHQNSQPGRTRRVGYRDTKQQLIEQAVQTIQTALMDNLSVIEPERKRVLDAAESSIREVYCRTFPFDYVAQKCYHWSYRLGGFAPLVALPVVLIFGSPAIGFWGRVGAGIVASVICYTWSAISYALIVALPDWLGGINSRRRARHLRNAADFTKSIPLLAFATLLVTAAVLIPAQAPGAPSWLISGWFHEGLIGAAWVVGSLTILSFLFTVAARVWWMWILWRINRKAPEESFTQQISGLVATVAHLRASRGEVPLLHQSRVPGNESDAEGMLGRLKGWATSFAARFRTGVRLHEEDEMRILLAECIELAVEDFERDFPKSIDSKRAGVQEVVRTWTEEIAAYARAQELPLILGQRLADVEGGLTRTIVRLVRRQPASKMQWDGGQVRTGIAGRVETLDAIDNYGRDELLQRRTNRADEKVRRRVWWKQLGRWIVAAVFLAIASFLALVAVWQPGLPDYLGSLGWHKLSAVTRVETILRAPLLSGSVAFVTITFRVVAPERSR